MITIKKVKIIEELSEETICFSADMYFKGKYICPISDIGQGGDIEFHIYANDKEYASFLEAVEWAKSLDPLQYEDMSLPMDIELYIGQLIEDIHNQKEDKKEQAKLKKDMAKGICYKTVDGYGMSFWKGITLTQLLSSPNPAYKKAIVDAIKALIGEGKEILNTNIPKEYYEKY